MPSKFLFLPDGPFLIELMTQPDETLIILDAANFYNILKNPLFENSLLQSLI